MRRAIAAVLVIAGCGSAVQYGSFVDGDDPAQVAIAADAAGLLAAEYVPDSYSIRLTQEASDAFGRAFDTALRRHGYRVKDAAVPNDDGVLEVRYVVDRLKGTDLLRITIYVQRRRLSRAYANRKDGLYPVGPWSSGVHDG